MKFLGRKVVIFEGRKMLKRKIKKIKKSENKEERKRIADGSLFQMYFFFLSRAY